MLNGVNLQLTPTVSMVTGSAPVPVITPGVLDDPTSGQITDESFNAIQPG